MTMRKAMLYDLEACADILFSTKVGQTYYPTRKRLQNTLKQGVEAEKIWVATAQQLRGGGTGDSLILGFIWFELEGIFHTLPYLYLVAVRETMRGQGVGSFLLDFMETTLQNHYRNKVFLTVADFNANAERLYRQRGYTALCEIPNLYRQGITEKLMVKIFSVPK